MRILLFTLLILSACNPRGRKAAPHEDIRTTANTASLELYTYGLANFDGNRARFRTARKWGFSYRTIAGCVVTRELVDSATRHNRVVDAALSKVHGAGWKERFEKEVEEAIVLDKALQRVAPRNAVIAAAQKTLDSQGKGLLFEPTGARTGQGFEVVAYTYDTWQGKQAYVTQYKLMVDTAANRTDITSDSHALFQTLE